MKKNWIPLGATNDYQYIKSKWLLELLNGGYISLHKDFGFILNNNSDLCAPNQRGPLSPSWPNKLLGSGTPLSRFYHSVLKNTPRAN